MGKIIMFCLVIGIITGGYAQEKEYEQQEQGEQNGAGLAGDNPYSVKNSQDFIDAYTWLMQTPINEEQDKRQQVTASLVSWIEENPDVEIELDSKLLKFADTSPELMVIFMGGYTAHMIKNNNTDKVEANKAGIESVIDFYQANEKFLERDKKVEKFIKLQEKEKLDRFVERKS